MERRADELLRSQLPDGYDSHSWLYLLIVAVVGLGAVFVGQMLFGDNSLEVLLKLKREKSLLERKLAHLQSENARLQLKCFEYKNLQPLPEGAR